MGGTLLTKRDTFLTRSQTMQLIYAACTATQVGGSTMPSTMSLCNASSAHVFFAPLLSL